MIDSPALLDVAAALADGTPIDWDGAEQSASSDEDRQLLAELRFIALIGRPAVESSSSAQPDGSTRRALAPAAIGPELPETWGPLRLLERVGHGSFGDVYRAWDPRLDREVALKLLRHREHDDGARDSIVIREGRMLARVRHPSVVAVYGAERIDGQVGVWMEFIHGKTLEQELRERGPFDVDRAIGVGIDLADALTTVHRAGLIHGDVKAHNVMQGRDGRTVLTDFGAGFEVDETLGASRNLAGTPVCIAPEVFAGQTATPASDVYSLGVLLYHLVTGEYPVRGGSIREIRAAHAARTRTPLAAARPDLPATFVRIVDRAIDPDPDSRYSSPADLRRELISLRHVEPEGVPVRARTRSIYFAAVAALILTAAVSAFTLWKSETPTIAVLPLQNLSADPNGEYFVDGLTDEIIRNLSVIDGLDVRSRTSSFMFKGKTPNLRDVGQQLRATLIVEGSVLRSDDKLRVNVQLVRAADDVPIWSRTFDRELKDVFSIQDEIARSIVNELRLTLGRGQRRYNTNLEAYEVYLRARSYGSPINPVQGKMAADLFQQVIDRDRTFAPAYAGLADAWAAMSINRGEAAVAPDDAFAAMKPAAERALQLDPLLAEAHAAMGVVLARDRKWAEAEAAFRRATELNGSLSAIRVNFVMSTLWPQGKVDESVRQLRDALRRDPLSIDVQARLAYVLVSAGGYQESIEIGRRIVASAAATNDGLNHSRQVLARALFHHGDKTEAVHRFEQLGSGSDSFRGFAYALTGRHSDARALAIQRRDFPAGLVIIYAGLGETDRAFDALERMAAEKDPRLGIYLTYPELAALRQHPRMNTIRQKLGLPANQKLTRAPS